MRAGCEVNLDWGALPELFPGFERPSRWLPLLQQHAGIISRAEPHTRVTSVNPAEAVRRHYAESLELLRIIEELGGAEGPLVDVGSGGGFPGLLMAIVRPALEVHLIEPLQKRARLLTAAAAELGLAQVAVYPVRAEEAGRGELRDGATLVTARAVAQLSELLEYTAPFAAVGATIVFPKGSSLDAELASAANALAELGCEHVSTVSMRQEVSEAVRVAVFRKIAATPAKYPRRPGMPAKRPL